MFSILGVLLISIYIADFLTGFFHWLEDTYCSDNTIHGRLLGHFIGKYVCDPNIDHHLRSHEMVDGGTFFTRNLIPWLMALSASMVALLIDWYGWWFTWHWSLYATFWFASMGNEIHRLNHMRDNQLNPFQLFLRDSGLIQARTQHSLHHKPPFDRHYCVLVSFNNAWLERVKFWRRTEWFLFTVFGLKTQRENRRDVNMGKSVASEP